MGLTVIIFSFQGNETKRIYIRFNVAYIKEGNDALLS